MAKTIYLCGSIGGLKSSAATVGTFFALKKLGWDVVGLAGSSGGSMALPLLSKGLSMQQIIEAIESIKQNDVLESPYDSALQVLIDKLTPWKRKNDERFMGVMRGNKLLFTLEKLYKKFDCRVLEKLPIPVAMVASRIAVDDETAKLIDANPEYALIFALHNSASVAFTSGNAAQAARASCSIPAVFRPFQIDGNLYVDGGSTCSLPALTALEQFGNNNVLIVDVSGDAVGQYTLTSEVNSFIDAVVSVIKTAVAESTNEQLRRATDKLSGTEFQMKRITFPGLKQTMFDTTTFRTSVNNAYVSALKELQNL